MQKPRLRRLDWVYTDCPAYFLTACTASRRPLLASEYVRDAFREFSIAATHRGIWVGRYVLMPDHLHLFAAFAPNAIELSAWMKALKGAISQALRNEGLESPFWQKGFFDHLIRSAESYQEKWTYVCQNPVRAGLVTKAEDWPYQGEIHCLSVS
jgi:REP-associated tyrosine transposase